MGEYQDLPSKIFCLTVPKISVEESLDVALISVTEKVWIRGGGDFQGIPSKIFCLTVPKIFLGESFTVALFSGYRESLDKTARSIKIFHRKFFVSQSRKFL